MRLFDESGNLYPLSTPIEKLDIGLGPLLLLKYDVCPWLPPAFPHFLGCRRHTQRSMAIFYSIVFVIMLPALVQDILQMKASSTNIVSYLSIANFGTEPISILQGICECVMCAAYLAMLLHMRWQLARIESGHEYRFIQTSDCLCSAL